MRRNRYHRDEQSDAAISITRHGEALGAVAIRRSRCEARSVVANLLEMTIMR
jgi:hypothetical protein